MARDFGIRRQREGFPLARIAWIGAAVFAIGGVGATWWWHRSNAMAELSAWKVEGPPCRTLSRHDFAALQPGELQAFDYGGARFARKVGHVDCSMTAGESGRALGLTPVCQFTGPIALAVFTSKGEFYYFPGPGQGVTVSVEHGRPACALGSRFREALLARLHAR